MESGTIYSMKFTVDTSHNTKHSTIMNYHVGCKSVIGPTSIHKDKESTNAKTLVISTFIEYDSGPLTRLPLVPHICVSESG